jgi:hypothetical protein
MNTVQLGDSRCREGLNHSGSNSTATSTEIFLAVTDVLVVSMQNECQPGTIQSTGIFHLARAIRRGMDDDRQLPCNI